MTESILVVANGEPPSPSLLQRLIQTHAYLVAVDGGLKSCLEAKLEPQLLIGDFDSVTDEERRQFSHIRQIHTPDQNKSDLEKTLSYLFDSGAKTITVCGAIGKRLDHTLTNICLLSRYPDKVKFETDHESCFALTKSSVIKCHVGQILSLIPASTRVTRIFTQGLKWELTGDVLSKEFVSISNVCLQKEISISFKTGDLIACLIHSESTHEPDKGCNRSQSS